MKIDLYNYEAYLLDRMEGRLSEAELRALDAFLIAHPELAADAQLTDLPVITDDAEAHAYDKRDLYRALPPAGPIDASLDDHLVALLEGDLDDAKARELSALIATDAPVAKAWRQMQATRMSPITIVFPEKRALKREGAIIIPLWQRIAVAASVALLLGLAWWILNDGTSGSKELQIAGEQISPNAPQVGTPGTKDTTLHQPARSTERAHPLPSDLDAPEGYLAYASPERIRLERLDPLAEVRSNDPDLNNVTWAHIPDLPIAGPPLEEMALLKAARTKENKQVTIPELLADVVRREILGQEGADVHPLDDEDALAAVGRGLEGVTGARAGLDVERENGQGWTQFKLRLGQDLTIAASRGR